MTRWGKQPFGEWRCWGQRSHPVCRAPRARRCCFEWLEERVLLCGDGNLATAMTIDPTDVLVERINSDDNVALFSVTLDEPGRLTIETRPEAGSSVTTRTSLLGPDGQLLITSDGQSKSNSDDLIVQHLLAGNYFVRVEGLDGSTGDYALITHFDSATPPNDPLVVNFDHDYPYGLSPSFHVIGDFNGNGHLDIATPNTLTNDVSVLLGLGDGSFQSARNFNLDGANAPLGIVTADFNDDGIADLATNNELSNDVSVLLGSRDGTFTSLPPVAVGTTPLTLEVGDWNEDGHADLAVANGHDNDISILLGTGDGSFQLQGRFATGKFPSYLAIGDFDGDGHADLVVANFNSNDLSLLRGLGDGSFAPEVRFATASNPSTLVTADFNHDGHLDLAGVNTGSSNFSIYWGQGDGKFVTQVQGATGSAPIGLVAGDFNRDGLIDLAASNRHEAGISVFIARPDGTFEDQVQYQAGTQPWYILAGDFNEDSFPDLTTANARSHDVSILLGLGDGTFQEDPTGVRQGETNPQGMVSRDFNGDGLLDLAATSYTGGDLFVFLGRGDGTFQERIRFAVGSTPVEILSDDFNHDGHHDLITINCDSGDISVLLGRGDGTFQNEVRYGSSVSGEFGVTGDFNGDGNLDVIASGQFATGIALIPGRGDGTFGEQKFFANDESPADGVAGDFNRDGRLDVATTNFFSPNHDVSIHLGLGDGTFEPPQHYPVGDSPLGIVTGDFNGDGFLDLVNSNFRSQSISLLLGRGDGSFDPEVRFAIGLLPDFFLARDFDGDGRLDVVVSNAGTKDVSVLRGRGDGTFADAGLFTVGDLPTPRRGLDAGDFNGDGRLDLAIPQVLSNDVAVLLGSGDARFSEPLHFPVGLGPVALTAGDFSGDGRLDVASVNPTANEVTISLGAGDTTLLAPQHIAVGLGPVAVVQGDFNRDGRLDLATANHGSGDVSLLLGVGTGAFQDEQRLKVGANPTALTTGDFNGDGRLDLASANVTSNDVSILLGRGDGTFLSEHRIAAGGLPQALATGDFNRDGRIDLATANYRSSDITILLGRGDGTFQAPRLLAVGKGPVSLLASDFNADGVLDLATANYLSHDVSVLPGQGDGTFRNAESFAAGDSPVSLTSGDFDGDGHLDLATANSNSDNLTLLLGRGDGSFAQPLSRRAGEYPVALASADFNGDARTDLAVATQLAPQVSILQGLGDATFAAAGAISNRRHATPLVADYTSDGLPDVALLDLEGKILLRVARAGAAGFFEAPRVVNPDEQYVARDLAIVSSQDGSVLAALDAKSPSISLYTRQRDGKFTRQAGPQVPGKLPVAIRSADLNGDGRRDLVVAAAGSNQVFVYLQSEILGQPVAAGFAQRTPDFTIDVGVSPSAIELADVNGDQRPDILVTSQFSGDVSVFYNHPDDSFSCQLKYGTGTGLYSLVEHDNRLAVRSFQAPAGIVAGRFDSDSFSDLIVTNGGSNSLSILPGGGSGGFLNPSDARTFATGLQPTAVVSGTFNDDSYADLAVLNEGSANVSIFLGREDGGFTAEAIRPAAGNMPTGLAVEDVNGDGRQDLLIGNDFGDLLVLLGNDDGTFQPYQRADGRVALAVADLNADGREDLVFASQADDEVEVQYTQSDDAFRQVRSDGLLAPEAVATADLNLDGALDLVIANSGANNVLVYPGAGGGRFAPARRFFAGTRPVGVTVNDLNQDGLPDLVVANEGSNDVTILLGQRNAGGWTLVNGPRLRAGTGPVQTLVRDETRDGVPDILVTNAQSNDVFLLPGLGLGFFDDRNPLIRQTGEQPGQLLAIGNGLVTINQISNDITYFPNFLTSPGLSFGSGGQQPVAGLVGDFNGDRFSDLLVAHQGNGVIRLLAGGPDGFSLSDSFTHDDLPHPAAIASIFRGQEIDIFGVNERGGRAVLIAALTESAPASTPLSPLPLSGLLVVVGPGFELAMSVLTASTIAAFPLVPRGVLKIATIPNDAPPDSAEAAGSGDAEDSPEPKQSADEDQRKRAHDAAISELLSGVDDALAQRPPQLSWDEGSSDGEPKEARDSVGEEPIQKAIHSAPVTISTGVSNAVESAERQPAAVEPLATASCRNDSWIIDPMKAAALAVCLLTESWAVERISTDGHKSRPRRARFFRHGRPSS